MKNTTNNAQNEVKQVYIGGDMLYKGSQLLRAQEAKDVLAAGLKPYAPQDDKEINDKTNQTKESNDGLAEKIVRKDTDAMINSDVLIFDYQRFAEGTIAEIGQIKGMKDMAMTILENWDDQGEVLHICAKMITKRVYIHCEDVRRTDIPEQGDRRSFGVNQYVYGVALDLTGGVGFYEWNEILADIKD